MADDKRLNILTDSEVDDLYGVPEFTDAQRDEYFYLDDAEQALISRNNDGITNAYRVLILGHLKHKPVIHQFTFAEVKADLDYIRKKYQFRFSLIKAEINRTQRSRIYDSILNFAGYERFDEEKHQLTRFVSRVADQIAEPREVFDRCVSYLAELDKPVAIPAYSTLQKIISEGIKLEEKTLENRLLSKLSTADLGKLRKMAVAEDEKPLITRIKKLPKTFQRKEIYAEVEVFNKIQEIFPSIKLAVESLDISKKNIEYFGSLVTYYSISRLRTLPDGAFALILSCFLYQRYFYISDILIQGFIYHVRKLVDEAREYGDKKHHNALMNLDEKIKKAGKILNFYVDTKIKDSVSFSVVRKKAFDILSETEIPTVSNFFSAVKTDAKKYQWEFYDEKRGRIEDILRKLFLCHDFGSYDDSAQALLKQVQTTQRELKETGKMSTFDTRLIKPELRPHLLMSTEDEESEVNVARAEMLLYIRIKDRMEDLKFCVDDSLSYGWYENDFVAAQKIPELVDTTNLINLKRPVTELLEEKKQLLTSKLKAVGARLSAGENPHVIFADNNGKTKWSIKQNTSENDQSERFYRKVRQTHIGEIIALAERDTQFSSKLTHKRVKTKPTDLNAIIACIVANGTRFGTHHMATLCNMPYDHLLKTENDHLRGETIHAANDLVSNAISKLSVFKYYNIQEDVIHASVDGQRLQTRFNTISTQFSSKYFGRGKGLSAITLSANHVPVNAEIMKPYTHESHYLFDLLFNNTSDIQPTVVSTDNHGTNQFNFGILDLSNFSFAPRYARPGKTLSNLFRCVQTDDGCEMTLVKPINYKLITDGWEFIQQILMSLHNHEISQANLVRKISRLKTKSNPFRALAEYDRLIKCIYMLDFIDDSTFRGYTQRALNRGESYHQLQRRIEQVNGSKLRGNSDTEISLWYECSRLIANCVIYFNSYILSLLVDKFEKENNLEQLEDIKHCSPVAWTHINFNGSYTFSFDGEKLEIYELLQDILGP